MRHDPEADAIAYLGAAMPRRRARRFEAHLLGCDACWGEMTLAVHGRSLAEASRELAPQCLREGVRMAVAGSGNARRHRAGLGVAGGGLSLALATVSVLVVVATLARQPASPQPVAIAQAVADFRDGRLPAGTPRAHRAPDLSGIGFELIGSGAGQVGRVPVDAFGYQDASGKRVLIYLSSLPFPEAAGAHYSGGADGPWTAGSQGVRMLCAEHPLALLALSDDSQELRAVATDLGVQ